MTLQEHRKSFIQCQKCHLYLYRRYIVYGEGNPNARIVFVGESPGFEENKVGIPFIGESGNLFNVILEKGLKIKRSDIFISNVVKCFPSKDNKGIKPRIPEPDEIKSCTPYLETQIEIIKPEIIVALGNTAMQFLLKTNQRIMQMRGKWGEYKNIPVLPMYHPAHFLYNDKISDKLKKELNEDIQKITNKLNRGA